ncbi:MAG: RluA family pseudouridine synthase [Hyphomicrobiales bacterium]
MSGVSQREVAPEEEGMRLDRWFKALYPDLSFGRLQKLLRSGQVRLDGKRVKSNQRLQVGQIIRVPPLQNEACGAVSISQAALSDLKEMTLYDDGTVMVLNKPAGLAVQGGSGQNTHVDKMLASLEQGGQQRGRLVHRLDKETSGVLVIGRTRAAASKLAEAFKARETRKIYWSLVRGVPKPREGRISTWLGKQQDETGERMRSSRMRRADASHAVTHFVVADQAAQRLAWLIMQPVTGRTHQLRAHAADIGHPIIGDGKYFNIENWELPGGMQNRLHLHANSISIPHPDGGLLEMSAPLPAHMQQSWNLLGFVPANGAHAEELLP